MATMRSSFRDQSSMENVIPLSNKLRFHNPKKSIPTVNYDRELVEETKHLARGKILRLSVRRSMINPSR